MSLKEEALQDIVKLARTNQIKLDEIAQALQTPKVLAEKQQSSSVLSRLFGYLGGIFVFAGIAVFIGMYWDDFGSAARVLVTLGIGFAAFVMALVCLTDARYEKAATPLFLMAAWLQPAGILVMLQEYSSGGNPQHGIAFMTAYMLIQQGAAFWAKQRTVLVFCAIFFGAFFFANLLDMWGWDEDLIGLVMGISLTCIAYALHQSRHLAISPFWYFSGSVILLTSVFHLVKRTPLEIIFLGLCAAMIFVSTYVRSRTLLLVGTIAMFYYIAYFTAELFANTLGWPIVLVMIGIVLIAMSSVAVRLNNKYIKQ